MLRPRLALLLATIFLLALPLGTFAQEAEPPVEETPTFECPADAEVCLYGEPHPTQAFEVVGVAIDGGRQRISGKAWIEGDMLRISLGCNYMTAPASLEGDLLSVGEIMTTLIGCDEPTARAEALLSSALARGPFRLEADQLVGEDTVFFLGEDGIMPVEPMLPPDAVAPGLDFDIEQCRDFVSPDDWEAAFGRSDQGSGGSEPGFGGVEPDPANGSDTPSVIDEPISGSDIPGDIEEPASETEKRPMPVPTPSAEYCEELLSRIRTVGPPDMPVSSDDMPTSVDSDDTLSSGSDEPGSDNVAAPGSDIAAAPGSEGARSFATPEPLPVAALLGGLLLLFGLGLAFARRRPSVR